MPHTQQDGLVVGKVTDHRFEKAPKEPESMGTGSKPIAHWYAVDAHGAATLCTCEEDARETAAESDRLYPHLAPYTAEQLVPVSAPTSHPIPTGATGEDERQPDLCPRCDGSGEITVMSDSSPDAHDVNVCCDHCQGSGAAVDAAKFLAAALAGEKFRHMQLWAEYRNFHRSLCARFGYGHDRVHFRRDLVSLEEAIAAKVSAPAAGDALPNFDIEAAAQKMAECMDYPWAHMPEQGRKHMRESAQAVIDAALAAQRKGDA